VVNPDVLRATVERVRGDLTAAIWPDGTVQMVKLPDERASEPLRVALGMLKDAVHELHPNTSGGVNGSEAARIVREACDILESQILDSWLPDEVNTQRLIALRDLSDASDRFY
jgi:hypothetical protein